MPDEPSEAHDVDSVFESLDLEPRTVYCPTCANEVDTANACWIWNGHFYCSEACCRRAANG